MADALKVLAQGAKAIALVSEGIAPAMAGMAPRPKAQAPDPAGIALRPGGMATGFGAIGMKAAGRVADVEMLRDEGGMLRKIPSLINNTSEIEFLCWEPSAVPCFALSLWADMTINQLKNIILEAFVNVKLGGGVSLAQAKACDIYVQQTPQSEPEIPNNWRAISIEYLDDHPYLSSLDAEGFRYYLPAFLISVLENYELGSLRVIGTILALCPSHEELPLSQDYNRERYSLLTGKQKQAIAIFLSELPHVIELDLGDTRKVSRAVRHYWRQFLPNSPEEQRNTE